MSKTTKPSPAMIICAVCNKSFTFIKNLNRHRMNVHNLDRIPKVLSKKPSHRCPVCQLKFVERSSLRRHERLKHAKNFTESLRKKKSTQFIPSNLVDYPLFQKLFPEGYIYKINDFQDLGENQFKVKFEIPECSKNMFMIWFSEMAEKSKVSFRVKSFTKSPSPKVVFNKVYRCVHNTCPSKHSVPHPKHTGCPATFTVRVQKCWEALSLRNSADVDNVMMISLKAIATLNHTHNHILLPPNSADQEKPTSVCSDGSISPNISFSSEESLKNNDYNNSIIEIIEETIVSNEPESNEIELNDKINEIPNENNNFELSEELDSYILVEDINIENSPHNDAVENELYQLLSDYDSVNEKMLQLFESNPEYFIPAIKAYTYAMKKNLACKQFVLDGLHSFGNLLQEKLT